MRLLFLGDVMGRAGRTAISDQLKDLRDRLRADFVVVNAENATNGAGLSPDHAKILLDAGADVLTLGDHAFDQFRQDEAILELPGLSREEVMAYRQRAYRHFYSRPRVALGALSMLKPGNISQLASSVKRFLGWTA